MPGLFDGFIDQYMLDSMGPEWVEGDIPPGLMSTQPADSAYSGPVVSSGVMAPNYAPQQHPALAGRPAAMAQQHPGAPQMPDQPGYIERRLDPKGYEREMGRFAVKKDAWDKQQQVLKMKQFAEQTSDPMLKRALLSGIPAVQQQAIKQMYGSSKSMTPTMATVGAGAGMKQSGYFKPGTTDWVPEGEPYKAFAPRAQTAFGEKLAAYQDPNTRDMAREIVRDQWKKTDTGYLNPNTGEMIDKNIVEGKVQSGYGESISKQLEGYNDYARQSKSMEYELDRNIANLDALDESTNAWSTGWGSLLSGVPETDAMAWNQRKTTILSSMALDKMMELKAASPTGSTGFGALNEKELEVLQTHIAALKQANRAPEIKSAIRRIKTHLTRIKKDTTDDRKRSSTWYEKNAPRRDMRTGPSATKTPAGPKSGWKWDD